MSHVRSAGTSTPAGQSRAELEKILDRYGCTRSGSELDRHRQLLTVWFTVPDGHGEAAFQWIPVRLVVRLADVKERLQAHVEGPSFKGKKGEITPEMVERVAWRHIVFLVEAGLVAAAAGVKRVSEFFLADTVILDVKGREGRMIDFLDAMPGEPWRAMLGKGSPHEVASSE